MAGSIVLAPFPYAGDGFTVEHLVAGDIRDFGEATDGLFDAGLIGPADEVPHPAESVEDDPAPVPRAARRGRK